MNLRLTRVLSCWFAFVATSGVASAGARYEIVDSGFPAEDAFPTIWIDDRLVLFTGVELGQPLQPPNSRYTYRGGLKIAAFVWDSATKTITKFSEAPIRSFCSTGSFVSYQLSERSGDKDVVAIYAGNFGEEKPLGRRSELPFFNPVSCRYHVTPWLPPEAKERRIAPLLEEHGYVDFGAERTSSRPNVDTQPVLKSLTGNKSFPLDIEPQYVQNGRLSFAYLPFADQYFSRANTIDNSWLSPAFYLQPNGVVRKVEFRRDIRVSGVYHPTKVGVVLTTDGNRRGINGGAYLIEREAMTQVAEGSLRAASVSPNGCRVAFVYAKSWQAIRQGYAEWKEGRPGNTLRMIDLCEATR